MSNWENTLFNAVLSRLLVPFGRSDHASEVCKRAPVKIPCRLLDEKSIRFAIRLLLGRLQTLSQVHIDMVTDSCFYYKRNDLKHLPAEARLASCYHIRPTVTHVGFMTWDIEAGQGAIRGLCCGIARSIIKKPLPASRRVDHLASCLQSCTCVHPIRIALHESAQEYMMQLWLATSVRNFRQSDAWLIPPWTTSESGVWLMFPTSLFYHILKKVPRLHEWAHVCSEQRMLIVP